MSTLYAIYDYTIFDGKSWQEKMDSCNKCDCCEHHKLRKPRLLLPYNDDYDCVTLLDDSKEVGCRCKWRYLARRMCEEANFKIMTASPSPSELPMPPQEWLKDKPKHDLSLLDWATEQAIEHHWRTQVKACQYAIFHIC